MGSGKAGREKEKKERRRKGKGERGRELAPSLLGICP